MTKIGFSRHCVVDMNEIPLERNNNIEITLPSYKCDNQQQNGMIIQPNNSLN